VFERAQSQGIITIADIHQNTDQFEKEITLAQIT
jgi:hypothetical protein